jgi:hypothetical protein
LFSEGGWAWTISPESDPSLRNQLQEAIRESGQYPESPIFELTQTLGNQLSSALRAGGLSPSIHELMRQPRYQDWNQALAEAAGGLASAYNLMRRAGVEEFAKQRISSDWLLNIQAVASPVLGMIANELLNSAAIGRLNPALVEGFGAELMGYITSTEAADSEEKITAFLQAFLIWLLEQARRLPGTKTSSGAILSIFLTIASMVYSQYSSNETEERLNEKIHRDVSAAQEEILDEIRKGQTLLLDELELPRFGGHLSLFLLG